MPKHRDKGLQQIEAFQLEAARLAEEAKEHLTAYAQKIDMTWPAKNAQAAVDDIQHSAESSAEQISAAMAAALEDAAGRLRGYTGHNPIAQAAQNAAGALERGSDRLQPWGGRSLMRRAQHSPLPALLLVAGLAGAAYLVRRWRNG